VEGKHPSKIRGTHSIKIRSGDSKDDFLTHFIGVVECSQLCWLKKKGDEPGITGGQRAAIIKGISIVGKKLPIRQPGTKSLNALRGVLCWLEVQRLSRRARVKMKATFYLVGFPVTAEPSSSALD